MIQRTVLMSPAAKDMPVPALRLWAYLIANPEYKGTPSGLREEMTDAGWSISRRYLPVAIDWLTASGMIRSYRRGSFLEVSLSSPEAA